MKPLDSLSDEKFCQTVLTQKLYALLKELVALKSHSSEKAIHDARVQSRRMRAALDAFQDLFNPGPYRIVYRDIKQITRLLGKIRETGVVLGLMRRLGDKEDAAEGICREYMIERISDELRKQEMRLRRNLNSIDPLRLQSQIQSLMAGVDSPAPHNGLPQIAELSQTVARRRRMPQTPKPVLIHKKENNRERAQHILKEMVQPILAFRPRYQFERATDESLHKIRISAKKLRYAMEIFSPYWPDGLKNKIADARSLQDAGGAYHDWCVLCQILKTEIQRAEKSKKEHHVFQIGHLLEAGEAQKAKFRKRLLPAITTCQSTLRLLLPDLKNAPPRKKSLSLVRAPERKKFTAPC
jgi:CHAD domain-containing protein